MGQQQDPAQPAGLADAAEASEALLREWHTKAKALGWPTDLEWRVAATARLAQDCLGGSDPTMALRALADQRFDQTATPAEFELDISALASCAGLPESGELTQLAADAAQWVIARDHTLAQLTDPLTALRTRTAFVADLTYRGSLAQSPYVWVARWRPGTAHSVRLSVATCLGDRAPHESAGFLGSCSLAMLVAHAARGQELTKRMAEISELTALETTLVPRPDGDPTALAEWLVSNFPELVQDPLP